MNVFSIVIPVHNKEKYLKKTLDSVLNQTYTHFELILVNDGSDDISGEICNEYAELDKRIRVIHQKNGGVSNARNNGIKAAKNELISFLDADDFWRLDFLQEMNGLIESYPNVDLYSAKYGKIQNGKADESEKFFSTNDQYIVFDLIEDFAEKAKFPLHTSSVIIRKSAIVNAGYFDERIAMFEDYDLFVRIALNSKVAYLNSEPLSFYNLDVPAESKARGVMPKIEKHWVYYFDKFNEAAKNNSSLKLLLDRATLTQLIGRRVLPGYRKEVAPFLQRIDKKNYPLKYKLIYKTPPFVGNIIIRLNLFIQKRKK
jgi:glycosyltransferase involved in cell wall biosynthesis